MSARFLAISIALLLPFPAAGTDEESADLIADVALLEIDRSLDHSQSSTLWVDVVELHRGESPAGTLTVRAEHDWISCWRPGDVRRARLRPTAGHRYVLVSEGDLTQRERDDPDPFPPGLVAGSCEPVVRRRAVAPSFEERVVELVNQQRWSQGQLAPLKHDPLLFQAADGHSSNMALRDFYAHCDLDTGKSAWDRMADVGYFFQWAGENTFAGPSSPEAAVAGWMASSPHRANILSTEFREIGAGYAYQANDQGNVRRDTNRDCLADSSLFGPYRHYWTQKFGRRNTVYPIVIEREAPITAERTVDLFLYGSGWAQEMRLSNDGVHWSAWQPFSQNRSWQLSAGDGIKTVRVELRSGATVRTASDTIVLDTGTMIFTDGFESGGTAAWN